jgi:hypothetical protein
MRFWWAKAGLALVAVCSLSGCAFLLPKTQTTIKSGWNSYEEAQGAFDRIVPNDTRTNELNSLGFDPKTNPNVKVLTYLDVIQRFMPNPSIRLEDLDQAVRRCIEARERSLALEVDLNNTKSQRYGNAFLDVTGFVKKTHETGWHFNGLVLILDGQVVYKLASGQPIIDRYDKKVRALGPLQELEGVTSRVLTSVTSF